MIDMYQKQQQSVIAVREHQTPFHSCNCRRSCCSDAVLTPSALRIFHVTVLWSSFLVDKHAENQVSKGQ